MPLNQETLTEIYQYSIESWATPSQMPPTKKIEKTLRKSHTKNENLNVE